MVTTILADNAQGRSLAESGSAFSPVGPKGSVSPRSPAGPELLSALRS